jgi:hypothetical protein
VKKFAASKRHDDPPEKFGAARNGGGASYLAGMAWRAAIGASGDFLSQAETET